MEPLALASTPQVEHQAAMVALGRPGAGEELLAHCGFVDIERREIPFAAEYADPETYARAISSVGPAFEAIETIGEEAFVQAAMSIARQRVHDGLPLRAPIDSVGYIARKPPATEFTDAGQWPATSFLDHAPPSAGAQRLFDDDLQGMGYVMNVSKLWAHDPPAMSRLSELLSHVTEVGSLTFRQRGILVTACASAIGDSYCSLAWGKKLASNAGDGVAESVFSGDDSALDDDERVLARWARQLARDPNSTRPRPTSSHCRRPASMDRAHPRHHRLRGATHRLLHGQRHARRPTRRAAGRRSGSRPRCRHVRPADGRHLVVSSAMTVIKINAITVPEDSGSELARRFAAHAGAVDNQDGFEGFELLQPTDGRNQWLVITRWRDEAAFKAWVSSPAFAHGHAGADRPAPHGGPVSVASELWSYEVAGGSTGT